MLLIVHGAGAALAPGAGRAQGFLLVWLAFVGVAAGAAALGWALTLRCSTFRLLPPVAGAVPVRRSPPALYPALATLFTRAHRGLADPERA